MSTERSAPTPEEKKLWGEVATRVKREWEARPENQARLAKRNGQRWFQCAIPIQETARDVHSQAWGRVSTETVADHEQGALLDAIEAEGFDLIHAGFVFQTTGSVSRDKLLSTGQTQKVEGQVIGVYLFKANDKPAGEIDKDGWRAPAQEAYHEALAEQRAAAAS